MVLHLYFVEQNSLSTISIKGNFLQQTIGSLNDADFVEQNSLSTISIKGNFLQQTIGSLNDAEI
jgi:hypothetical protein